MLWTGTRRILYMTTPTTALELGYDVRISRPTEKMRFQEARGHSGGNYTKLSLGFATDRVSFTFFESSLQTKQLCGLLLGARGS